MPQVIFVVNILKHLYDLQVQTKPDLKGLLQAPGPTDPIILLCALFVSSLSNYGQFFAFISFAGAIFLLYMAYETFIIDEVQIDEGNSGNSPFYKGIITNLLNPNPYVYWTLIGSPFLIKAFEEDVFLPFVFLFS